MNAETKVKAERNVKLNIAQRLNAVMAEVDYIQKEKKAGMQYSIVSHDAVTAKVRPIMQAHGVVYYPRNLSVQQNGNRTEAFFTVRFENIDDRNDFIDVETFGYGVDQQDKGPGKAMSYGVKYALLKVLGLETGDDPDAVQDKRADFQPANNGNGDRKRKLDGTYDTIPKLETAAKEFIRTLSGMSDLDDFMPWVTSKDVDDFLVQLKRDLPDWWNGGASLPNEYTPLRLLIAEKKRDLEQADEMRNRERTVLDAG